MAKSKRKSRKKSRKVKNVRRKSYKMSKRKRRKSRSKRAKRSQSTKSRRKSKKKSRSKAIRVRKSRMRRPLLPPALSIPSSTPHLEIKHPCLPDEHIFPILESDQSRQNRQWKHEQSWDLNCMGGGCLKLIEEGDGREIARDRAGHFIPLKSYPPGTFLGWVSRISDENTHAHKKGVMTLSDKISWQSCLQSKKLEGGKAQCEYILKLFTLLEINCEDGGMPTSKYKIWDEIPHRIKTAIENAREEEIYRIEKVFEGKGELNDYKYSG